MHNNDIATFKSLYGNDTKRLKLPQIRKKFKKKAGLKLFGREIEVYIFHVY